MAFLLWRAAMKKYTAVKWEIRRNSIALIVPTKKAIKAFEDTTPAIVVAQDNQLATISTTVDSLQSTTTCESLCSVNPSTCSLEEILTHQQNTSDSSAVDLSQSSNSLVRVDVRKSRSKMKSYLKRCKDKLIGVVSDDQTAITHHEAVSQNPTTSWYLDESEEMDLDSPIVVTTVACVNTAQSVEDGQSEVKSYEVEKVVKSEDQEIEEDAKSDSETNKSESETGSLSEVKVIYDHNVENLVDRYLGHLYPDYANDTRIVLVRQARDILVLTYHGDVSKFEHDYLSPAATIAECLMHKHMQGWVCNKWIDAFWWAVEYI